MKQYLVPYFMSSHPGCTLDDAILLALYMKKTGQHPDQVQDFYPTPGTISTAMFYTELDPYTMEPVFVPKTREEKKMQRALLQYFKPENYDIVRKALKIAGRSELIGYGEKCLVPPDKNERTFSEKGGKKKQVSSKNMKNNKRKVSHQWISERSTANRKGSKGKRR